jgi:hypothetical protein
MRHDCRLKFNNLRGGSIAPSPLWGGRPAGQDGGGKGRQTSSSGSSPMPLHLLTQTEIEADWPRLGVLLAPAIAQDERRTPADVYADLIARRLHCLAIDGDGVSGIVILEFATATNGKPCCWVVYIAGRIAGTPRQWRRSVRHLMHHFESLAHACGATEMRVEGRNWAKILNDYEVLGDRPGRNELRKVL